MTLVEGNKGSALQEQMNLMMRYALVRDASACCDEEAANEVKRAFKVGRSGVGRRGNGRQSSPQLRNGTEGG